MQMEIKCAIVDDEPFARKGLASYIEKISFLKLVVECEDVMALHEYLRQHPIDLLFLDIEMPEMSGLDYVATLKNPPKVIVVSAYEQYALRGYELEIVDYLLKPVSFERFFKAANRAGESLGFASLTIGGQHSVQEQHIFVKVDKKLKKIQYNDLLFIHSLGNYIVIQTTYSQEIIYSTLQQMITMLPSNLFISCHRSYIINKQKVTMIEGNQLQIANHKVPIARNLKDEVLRLIIGDN
ncbi:LytR/AlgR family response regulator transcription factor [Sphingobacterium thalpophilum]|uniref:LytR/AlgR family response regulator transcription factor n=1 Tax=Sphingobacterium thalpophilum TaxID=259 RepID=UPI002D76775A|nr:LytTR family DNA-binding domain-containing protein [Sphingobacterium thalpophilum]